MSRNFQFIVLLSAAQIQLYYLVAYFVLDKKTEKQRNLFLFEGTRPKSLRFVSWLQLFYNVPDVYICTNYKFLNKHRALWKCPRYSYLTEGVQQKDPQVWCHSRTNTIHQGPKLTFWKKITSQSDFLPAKHKNVYLLLQVALITI